MKNLSMSILASAALIGSVSLASADTMSNNNGMMQPAANVTPVGTVVCHHDGEIIQGPSGPLLCHMKPVGGVHYKSREWFSGVGARAAASNQ